MTGEELKKRREELGLSITEVSLVTKISLRVLHAIEAMDKTQLPAAIFLKGLLKSYAQHLKLDADAVIKGYLAQVYPAPVAPIAPSVDAAAINAAATPTEKIQNEKVKEKLSEPNSQEPKVPFQMGAKAIWASVAVVALVVVVILARVMNRYQNETVVMEQKTVEKPVTTPTQPTDSQPTEAKNDHPVETNSNPTAILPIIQGGQHNQPVADSAAVVAANIPAPAPMPVPVQPQNKVEEPVAQPVAAATPPPPAEKKEEKKSEAQPTVVAQTLKITTPTPPAEEKKPEEKKIVEEKPVEKKPAAVAGSKELIFEALDKVNLVIKKGSKQYKVSLQPDEIHTVRYSDSIEVEVSDGGAVNIIQNGHDQGVAGDLGKPKKINL